MKRSYLVLIIGLLALLATSAMAQEFIHPTVELVFDEASYTYTYKITVTPQDSFPLGFVQLDTHVRNEGSSSWVMLGPIADGVDLNWVKTSFRWTEENGGKDSANWYAGIGQPEIIPEFLTGNWIGEFVLVAPGTQPGPGWGLTLGGEGTYSFTIDVPGPIVPEPSSLLALCSGLAGVGGMMLRRRKA